jgi:hypothetical protein
MGRLDFSIPPPKILAIAINATFFAGRILGATNFTPVEHAVDVKGISPTRRDEALQFLVTLVCPFSRCPPETSGDPMEMGIHGKHASPHRVHHHTLRNFIGNPR